MRINPKEELAGVSMLKIRDFFKFMSRYYSPMYFTVEMVGERFEVGKKKAYELLHLFEEYQWVEAAPSIGKGRYGLSPKGFTLSCASAAPLVSRANAQKAYDAFMERVREVNNNPYYLYGVTKVILFGSFLKPDAEWVSDVDLQVALDRKGNVAWERLEKRADELVAQGRFTGYMSIHAHRAYMEVISYLKSRSRILSFTLYGSFEHAGDHPVDYPHKVVYENKSAKRKGETT